MHMSHGRLGRLLALGQTGIERPTDHARVGRLRVAQLPGLVDRLAGQAKVGNGSGGRRAFPAGTLATALRSGDLAPLMRGIGLIREPALGLRLDLQGIGLGAVSGRYQLVGFPFPPIGDGRGRLLILV